MRSVGDHEAFDVDDEATDRDAAATLPCATLRMIATRLMPPSRSVLGVLILPSV